MLQDPGGIICHSFWKGKGSETFIEMRVNYYGEVSLKVFFKDYFNILSIDSYKEFKENDSLVLIAWKKSTTIGKIKTDYYKMFVFLCTLINYITKRSWES